MASLKQLPCAGVTTVAETFTVTVKSMEGKDTKVEAEKGWTVLRFKEEYEKWQPHGATTMNLQYKGRRMKDDWLLSQYNFEPGFVVQSLVRTKGG
ncbi:Ubiquitin-hypothetical protein-like protein RUB1 [Orchesella cincta]|uniref:Ubiquitin-like domain-containing protein n=1 Tax=Orchesella cincta TaxID=48709 RepID=A0A1D2M260_ORCCI|nr:Ubiquitin-hypothetical protein-like protein RUB1 [Orchesella cincta]